MRSRLSGPPGSRSPGRCPSAPLPPGRWSGGEGGSPGLTSSLLSTLVPGFPAPTPALGLSPPLPPPSSQPRARLPSAPPPPSARRPSRPPLTSAARLRVGAGRREVERKQPSERLPDRKQSEAPFLRHLHVLGLASGWRVTSKVSDRCRTHSGCFKLPTPLRGANFFRQAMRRAATASPSIQGLSGGGGVFRGPEAGSGLVARKGKAPELEVRRRRH